MTRVLVTGAAGFIGSHTVDALLEQGVTVCGIDNLSTGKRANLTTALRSPRFRLVEADVVSGDTLPNVMREFAPDVIIHLAALVSVQQSLSDPELNFRLNLLSSHLVAEAARIYKVRRIVFASSAAVYGNPSRLPLIERSETEPISLYGGAKLASEVLLMSYAQSFQITVRCQRYFNVFGPRQDPQSYYSGVISKFDRAFKEQGSISVFGDGNQTRDFVYVSDVAQANVVAATKMNLRSGCANICTGKQTSINELISCLASLYQTSPAVSYLPARAGDILHSYGSARQAESDLGFSSSVTIEDGLRQMIDAPLSVVGS